MQTLLTNEDQEASSEKIKADELGSKEARNMCSIEEAGSSTEDSTTQTSTEDQNECNIATSSDSNPNINTNDEDNTSTNIYAVQERPLRPAKRKQISERPSYKKPRGILKLRSKTIRIMK